LVFLAATVQLSISGKSVEALKVNMPSKKKTLNQVAKTTLVGGRGNLLFVKAVIEALMLSGLLAFWSMDMRERREGWD
jgi:hypothetical protein